MCLSVSRSVRGRRGAHNHLHKSHVTVPLFFTVYYIHGCARFSYTIDHCIVESADLTGAIELHSVAPHQVCVTSSMQRHLAEGLAVFNHNSRWQPAASTAVTWTRQAAAPVVTQDPPLLHTGLRARHYFNLHPQGRHQLHALLHNMDSCKLAMPASMLWSYKATTPWARETTKLLVQSLFELHLQGSTPAACTAAQHWQLQTGNTSN